MGVKTSLELPHGRLDLPVFLPDATVGVVRAVDSTDLIACHVQAVVMNIFHLMQHPGSSTVQSLGRLHEMCSWQRPIMTDSGGFQAYSLIRQNAKFGKLTQNGIVFQPEGARRKFKLTPEKCIQLQMNYGADIIVCLDDCTHVDDPVETQRQSVQRTIAWAKRCKSEYQKLLAGKTPPPLLFAVIQGGGSKELRRACAETLLEVGFDGYGFGGWPLDAEGNLLEETLGYVRELIPRPYPLHALGVGHPRNIVKCVDLGYTMFDCALPTRDARRGRLYAAKMEFTPPARSHILSQPDGEWIDTVYINDDKHIKTKRPLDPYCDCLACQNYSVGYLRHLFKNSETTYMRLATIHNLRFMTRLMTALRME